MVQDRRFLPRRHKARVMKPCSHQLHWSPCGTDSYYATPRNDAEYTIERRRKGGVWSIALTTHTRSSEAAKQLVGARSSEAAKQLVGADHELRGRLPPVVRAGQTKRPATRCRTHRPSAVVAVIDGVIHDTHDCSRDGTRCVYGYFSLPSSPQVNRKVNANAHRPALPEPFSPLCGS